MNGRLVQNFMDFGPRWSNVRAIHLGQGEALIDVALPAGFALISQRMRCTRRCSTWQPAPPRS